MRVAILGATGMLGHHAAIAARAAGHELVVLHRAGSDLSRLAELRAESRVIDVADVDSMVAALSGCDALIHAAAYYPTLPRPWREDLELAMRGLDAVLDAAERAGTGRIVYLGAAIALQRRDDGRPADETCDYPAEPGSTNPYVRCKWAMDRRCRERAAAGLPVSIAIPAMTFGEHDHGPSTGQLITRLANGTMPNYVRGNRNVIYAGDAGRGLVRVAEAGRPGERYLLTGENTDMDALIGRIAAICGRPVPKPAPGDRRSTPSALATIARYTSSSPPSRVRVRTCSFSPRSTASTRCDGMVASGSAKSK